MTTAGTPGRDRRRFPRYEAEIPVHMRKKGVDQRMLTADVSRHGAFVCTDNPAPLRQLVQLKFLVPQAGEIEVMCMVARWLPASPSRGAGMGVDFFALSKDAKNKWERFVQELKARDAAAGFDVMHTPTGSNALPPSLGVPLPPQGAAPPGMPDWMTTTSQTGTITVRGVDAGKTVAQLQQASADVVGIVGEPILDIDVKELRAPWHPPTGSAGSGGVPLPTSTSSSAPVNGNGNGNGAAHAVPPPPPDEEIDAERLIVHGTVLLLKLPDRAALEAFVVNEFERGGLFMKTTIVKEIGDRVDVVLVHPETDEEFHLEGTVVRRVTTGPVDARGLGIFFKALSPEHTARLKDFVDGGIEVVELGQVVSERQLELEAAVAREPDNAEALEALGSYLLDEEGDLGGALTALTRALVIGPSQISIHASLARAYRKIGDPVKVRAHERVAEALMLFQDKMKVRMGVGGDAE